MYTCSNRVYPENLNHVLTMLRFSILLECIRAYNEVLWVVFVVTLMLTKSSQTLANVYVVTINITFPCTICKLLIPSHIRRENDTAGTKLYRDHTHTHTHSTRGTRNISLGGEHCLLIVERIVCFRKHE